LQSNNQNVNYLEEWANRPDVLTEYLDDKLTEKLEDAIKRLYYPELQQFVVLVLTRENEFISDIEDALGAFQLGLKYFTERGYYHIMAPSKQTCTFLASLLLHNVYFNHHEHDAFDWLRVFSLRDKTEGLAYALYENMDYNDRGMFEFVYQNVEAQLGEAMPTPGNRPVRGQNTEHFWNVLWFYYNGRVDIYDNRDN
jgi:hypothetical protein